MKIRETHGETLQLDAARDAGAAGSLCESLVHLRYIWFNSANREDERRGRCGPDGARWSPDTADHSEGTGHRVGTMHDGFEQHRLDVRRDEHKFANQPVVNDDNSVIAGWCVACSWEPALLRHHSDC